MVTSAYGISAAHKSILATMSTILGMLYNAMLSSLATLSPIKQVRQSDIAA